MQSNYCRANPNPVPEHTPWGCAELRHGLALVANAQGVVMGIDEATGSLALVDRVGVGEEHLQVASPQESQTVSSEVTASPMVPRFVTKARERYPKAWSRWTAQEDALLLKLQEQGATSEQMSEALQRGPGGCLARLECLACGQSRRQDRVELKQVRQSSFPWGAQPPVCQMDWLPQWLDYKPEAKYIAETAAFWGVPWDALERTLQSLEPELLKVITLRYGLARRCSFTLAAVAEGMQLSEAQVAKMQIAAEKSIREQLVALGFDYICATFGETLNRKHVRGRRSRSSVIGYE